MNTRDKRASVLGLGLCALVILPAPNSTITQGDRQHVAYSYSGIAAESAVVASPVGIVRATVRVDVQLSGETGLTVSAGELLTLGIGTPGTVPGGLTFGLGGSASDWTSLRSDLAVGERFAWRRGMAGGGPLDRLATTGTLEFGLKNHTGNSGGIQGWYSPNHASCRSGWGRDIPVRVVVTYGGTDYPVWRGKVLDIDPIPGKYAEQRVRVTAQDCMADFAENEVREVDPQVDQTETTCLEEVIDALPAEAQPVATSFDSPLDVFPYALFNLGTGVSGMSALMDILDSCQGFGFPAADGTFTYVNRHTRATTESDFTFTATMLEKAGLEVPSGRGNVYSHVQVTIHPITPTPAIVLYGITGAQYVEAGQTFEITGEYTDPTAKDRRIGGASFSEPITATTDYMGNSAENGSGDNLTTSLSVVTTADAASATFAVTNNHATSRIYLVNGSGTPLLQVRGTGLFDEAPQTLTAGSGSRLLEIDLRYQDDAAVAQDLADYLVSQYAELADQIDAFVFNPQRSHALMLQALTTEIGDVKTVSETMTGVDDVAVFVQAIEFEVMNGDYLACRFATAPKGPDTPFILDDVDHGVLDADVLGWG